METDYQKLYNNLTILLQDICHFLSADKLGPLSQKDKKLVDSLITRSKVQLQEIEKIEKHAAIEEYVDMDAKKVVVHEEDEEKVDIYSSVDDINKNMNMEPIIPQEEPYIDLPAKEADQSVKCGFLYMKRKLFLGFEKMRRVYGTIHNQWLLIYNTDKEGKTLCTFNLKNYEAKESDGPKSTNFELISTLDRKVFYFMALTPKDMLQWVAYINRCHDTVVAHSKALNLGIELETDDDEHYDSVLPGSGKSTEEMDEDDIYLELDDIRKPQNNNTIPHKNTEIVPPLPGRRPLKEGLIPVVKSSHSSENSLASYDDITDLSKTTEQSTEDEDDATYQSFIHVQNKVMKMSVPLHPANEIKEPVIVIETITTEENVNASKTVIVDDKIDKMKTVDSSTVTEVVEAVTEKEEKFRNINQSSFVQEIIKKANKQNSGEESKDGAHASKNFKFISNINKGTGLDPPVIQKVPPVPLKPRVRDKPSIGKRPHFSNFKHITDNS